MAQRLAIARFIRAVGPQAMLNPHIVAAPRDSRARYCECGRRISANKRVCLECAEKACVETSLDAGTHECVRHGDYVKRRNIMNIAAAIALAMAFSASMSGQTLPTVTQLKTTSPTPCVLVFMPQPVCAVLDPSIALTTVNGVTTLKAVVQASPPGVAQFVFGEGYTATGAVATYTLANTPIAGTVQAYRNGIRQALGTDFTLSGSVVTFLGTLPGQTIPQAGDLVIFDYQH